jgi:hypothetical protein
MRAIRGVFLALALFVTFGVTPAFAAKPALQLAGASPTLAFGPADCAVGQQTCTYVFTNEGTGTVLGKKALTFRYEERGTVLPGLGQRIDTATYTIALLKGKKEKPGKPVVLHVIPSTNDVRYDNPAAAPCTTGTFSQRTVEGAVITGTFGTVPGQGGVCPPDGGVPSGSMQFTIELNPKLERDLGD